MRGVWTIAMAALPLLAALPLGCTRDRARTDVPFEGARPLDLACVKEGRAPTRPELETIVRAVVDAAGGEAALRKRTFRRLEDLYLQRSGDPESHHVRVTTWMRPDQTIRTLLEYKSGESEQVGMHVVVEGWNPAFDCWVDPAGPMVVVLEATLPMTGDLVAHTETRQRVEYSDFRRVDGLLYAFRRDLSIDGKRFALADTREVVPAPSLPDELFESK